MESGTATSQSNSLRRIFHSVQTTMQRQAVSNQGNSTFYGASLQRQKSLKSGWLKKQGGMVKSWHRRWFTLKGDQMFYFSSEDDSKPPLGSIFLPGNKVVEHPMIAGEPDKFLFEILPGGDRSKMTSNHDTYPLWATSDEERKGWVRVIRKVMYSDNGGAIFGQSLEDTMAYEARISSRKVPQIVEMCVEFLMQHALDMEGVFRLPGRAALIRDLREEFDCGERPQFILPDIDVHTVASLLKQFLRDMPEPIIPKQFYEPVMKIVTRDLHIEHDPALKRLQSLLTHIPAINYNLLQYLCQFLQEVASNEDKNKMSAMNLATIFMQSFIRPEDDDPVLLMGTANGRTQVTFVLISQCNEVFSMEYTPEGNTVQVDKILDIENGAEHKPAAFDPDSSYIQHRFKNTSSSRISHLLDLSEDTGYTLPLPLAPEPKDEDHVYHTPYDAIKTEQGLVFNRSQSFDKASPLYAEIGSPTNRARSQTLPSPPPRPHRLSKPSLSLETSVGSSTPSGSEAEEQIVATLIATDLTNFSEDDLKAHIGTLCKELSGQTLKITELKAELGQAKALYKRKMQEMAQKLNDERTATTDAVARVVKLQAELQGYKMTCGKLQ